MLYYKFKESRFAGNLAASILQSWSSAFQGELAKTGVNISKVQC